MSALRLALELAARSARTVGAATHLLHLLDLLGGEDRRELIMHALLESAHLHAGVLLGELAVVVDGLHLLLVASKNRLKLSGLVRGQIKAASKALGLTLRVRLVVMHGRSLRAVLRRRRLLRESGTSAECKNEGCGEEGTVHRSSSFGAAGEMPCLHE